MKNLDNVYTILAARGAYQPGGCSSIFFLAKFEYSILQIFSTTARTRGPCLEQICGPTKSRTERRNSSAATLVSCSFLSSKYSMLEYLADNSRNQNSSSNRNQSEPNSSNSNESIEPANSSEANQSALNTLEASSLILIVLHSSTQLAKSVLL